MLTFPFCKIWVSKPRCLEYIKWSSSAFRFLPIWRIIFNLTTETMSTNFRFHFLVALIKSKGKNSKIPQNLIAKQSPVINNNVGGFHKSAGGRLLGLWILLHKCDNIILPQTRKIDQDSMSNWALKNMGKFGA